MKVGQLKKQWERFYKDPIVVSYKNVGIKNEKNDFSKMVLLKSVIELEEANLKKIRPAFKALEEYKKNLTKCQNYKKDDANCQAIEDEMAVKYILLKKAEYSCRLILIENYYELTLENESLHHISSLLTEANSHINEAYHIIRDLHEGTPGLYTNEEYLACIKRIDNFSAAVNERLKPYQLKQIPEDEHSLYQSLLRARKFVLQQNPHAHHLYAEVIAGAKLRNNNLLIFQTLLEQSQALCIEAHDFELGGKLEAKFKIMKFADKLQMIFNLYENINHLFNQKNDDSIINSYNATLVYLRILMTAKFIYKLSTYNSVKDEYEFRIAAVTIAHKLVALRSEHFVKEKNALSLVCPEVIRNIVKDKMDLQKIQTEALKKEAQSEIEDAKLKQLQDEYDRKFTEILENFPVTNKYTIAKQMIAEHFEENINEEVEDNAFEEIEEAEELNLIIYQSDNEPKKQTVKITEQHCAELKAELAKEKTDASQQLKIHMELAENYYAIASRLRKTDQKIALLSEADHHIREVLTLRDNANHDASEWATHIATKINIDLANLVKKQLAIAAILKKTRDCVKEYMIETYGEKAWYSNRPLDKQSKYTKERIKLQQSLKEMIVLNLSLTNLLKKTRADVY